MSLHDDAIASVATPAAWRPLTLAAGRAPAARRALALEAGRALPPEAGRALAPEAERALAPEREKRPPAPAAEKSPTALAKKRPLALAAGKRAFDLLVGIAALPLLAALVLAVALLNRSRNPGPLFFTQVRMGRGCVPFTIVKFRTMLPAEGFSRGHADPLEVERITPFGAFLRRTRLDELPQILNILRGEMSLVGPRPDAYHHALHYVGLIPGYRERHAVRPGITGLAQTVLGYAEGVEATARKVEADLSYIRAMSLRREASILSRTVGVVLTGFGAR